MAHCTGRREMPTDNKKTNTKEKQKHWTKAAKNKRPSQRKPKSELVKGRG